MIVTIKFLHKFCFLCRNFISCVYNLFIYLSHGTHKTKFNHSPVGQYRLNFVMFVSLPLDFKT
jgi:hypothetical protein